MDKTSNSVEKKSRTGLQTIERAVNLIELLIAEPDGINLFAMAKKSGLKAQTLQGILRSLQLHGLVYQPRSGGPYFLGPKIQQWSRRWLALRNPGILVRDLVEELAKNVNEYVLLSHLRGDQVIGLIEIQVEHVIMVSSQVSFGSPLTTLATGKVLLAWASQEKQDEIISRLNLVKLGPNTITDKTKLRNELKKIRENGYSIAFEEAAAGATSVAVPVFDAAGNSWAALGIAMPTVRFSEDRVKELLVPLKETAGKIESRWGKESVTE